MCKVQVSVALTLRKDDHEPLFCGATPAPSSLDELEGEREGAMV